MFDQNPPDHPKHMPTEISDVEKLRHQLADQHLEDFFKTIENPEDRAATHYQLLGVISKGIIRLLEMAEDEVQAGFDSDNLCPHCFESSVEDRTTLRHIAMLFNDYIGEPYPDPEP